MKNTAPDCQIQPAGLEGASFEWSPPSALSYPSNTFLIPMVPTPSASGSAYFILRTAIWSATPLARILFLFSVYCFRDTVRVDVSKIKLEKNTTMSL
jgi:hypothetical protein